MEKADKSKKVLMFEYEVLKHLQGKPSELSTGAGLPRVCKLYEFVERPNSQNFIVMQLLGKNLANLKKSMGRRFTIDYAIELLVTLLI